MLQGYELQDEAFNNGSRVVMTRKELGIKGLNVFGRHLASQVIPDTGGHYHRNCFEFAYVTKGNILFYVNDKEYRLSGGDIFVTAPNEVHSIGTLSLSISEMYWFQLDASEPDGFLCLEREWSERLIAEMHQLKNRVIKVDNRAMSYLMQDFYSLMVTQGTGRYEAIGLLTVFLHRMLRYDKQTRFSLTPDIARAVEYVLDSLNENIELEILADVSQLSLSRFKQKFKQQMGVTPREFINYQKIELAKTMLQEKQEITSIAMELGFSSSNYFAVVFKRLTSLTPSEYALHSANG